MGEFLTIWLLGLVAALALYVAGCAVFAWVAPARFAGFKARNIRRAQERNAGRTERRRLRKLASTQAFPTLHSRDGRSHEDHESDPLLHGLIAGAAASSLRGDLEEAVLRRAPCEEVDNASGLSSEDP